MFPGPFRSLLCLALCSAVAGSLSLNSARQDRAAGSQGQPKSDTQQSAPSAGSLSVADQRFIKAAAEGGMAEVELGRLAQLKGSSDEVKKFGQRMVEDHDKANDKLKELAAAKKITLPEKPNSKQEATKNRLLKLSGERFDKAYMREMVRDHEQDVMAFRTESHSGRDPDVRNFATTTLPTLQDHLKEAESITPRIVRARGTGTPPAASSH